MLATGIVRRTDDLGRIVIPKEIRERMDINDGQPMELYIDVEGESIIFKKYDFSKRSRYAIQKAINFIKEDTDLGVETRNEVLTKMKEALTIFENKEEDDV